MDPAQQLLDAIAGMRNQINATLAGLPPLEQFEAASELSYGVRSLTSYANNLKELIEGATSKITASLEKYKGDTMVAAEGAAEAKLLETGNFIRKTDHEAAVNSAIIQAQAGTRTEVEAEGERKRVVLTRRTTIVAEKQLPQVVVDKIPDEVLAGDGYQDHVGKLSERMKKLAKLNLTPENSGAFVAEMAQLPLDDAGEAAFTSRVGIIETAAKTARGSAPVNPLLGNQEPPATGKIKPGYF